MCSNVEVGKRRPARAASPPIGDEALASEKSGFPWEWIPPEECRRQRSIEIFDAFETHRHLGVDERVDDENIGFGRLAQRVSRPGEPAGIFSQYVENDVAVDQDYSH